MVGVRELQSIIQSTNIDHASSPFKLKAATISLQRFPNISRLFHTETFLLLKKLRLGANLGKLGGTSGQGRDGLEETLTEHL